MTVGVFVLLFTIGCCLYAAAAALTVPTADRWDFWIAFDEHDRRWTTPRMLVFGGLVASVGTLILRGVLHV